MGDVQSGLPMDSSVGINGLSSQSMSSISSEDSSDGDWLRDPHLVSLHFVTDPGQGSTFKHTIRPLIQSHDPTFRLFNVAERIRPNAGDRIITSEDRIPALAVVIFVHYADDTDIGDTPIASARALFAGEPWKLHHSSPISGERHQVCEPNLQDFHWTEPEMPLWAVRHVHYGNEHLRFMVYSSPEHFADMIAFYTLLLSKEVEYGRDGFCYFLIHSRHSTNRDIQLAIKRVPCGYTLKPLNSAFLQFKVREIGQLVPLLPNACSPLSPYRWQTTDPCGNVTLLLVKRKRRTSSGHTTPRRNSGGDRHLAQKTIGQNLKTMNRTTHNIGERT